jgi:uncharacterized OB-fold protein
MPKLIPVADALSKPFWDAVNQRRLVLQHCAACDGLQYPPQQPAGLQLGRQSDVEEVGEGAISRPIVIGDGRLSRRMPVKPYNLAMVTLDADIRVNFYSISRAPPTRRQWAPPSGDVPGGSPGPAHPRVAGRRLMDAQICYRLPLSAFREGAIAGDGR